MNKTVLGCIVGVGVVFIGLIVVVVGIFGFLVILGGTEMAEEVNATAEVERATTEAEQATAAVAAVSLDGEHTNAAGFDFAPPTDWQIVERNESGVGFVQLIPPDETVESAEMQFYLFISPIALLAQELPGDEVSLDAIADYTATNSTQAAMPENIEISLSEPYATTVGGEEALAYDIDGSVGRQGAKGRIVVAIVNNRQQYFAAVIIGEERQWENGVIADAVLNTVHFTGSTGS
jgi:Na+-transporting methylmalonyl-CoA/oxaloacetate decarboxylase gamma subunit